MAKLINKNLDLIHDKNIPLSTNGTSYLRFFLQEPAEINLKTSNFETFGCCTSTASSRIYENSRRTYKNEYAVLASPVNTFPSKFRNKKFINQWLDFINDTFEFCNVKLIAFDGKLQNEDYFKEKKLTFKNIQKDHIYFIYDKRFYPLKGSEISYNEYNYENLFTLSLLRYLTTYYYYFMVYETLRLRKLKSLKHLSNWEILNISKFANMDFETKTKNSSLDLKDKGFFMLYDYRSPLYNRQFQNVHRSLEELHVEIKKDQGRQNTACSNPDKHLMLNVIYLMILFQKAQYSKIFKLITNPKYVVNTSPTQKMLDALYPGLHNDSVKNYDINIKEYEKKL